MLAALGQRRLAPGKNQRGGNCDNDRGHRPRGGSTVGMLALGRGRSCRSAVQMTTPLACSGGRVGTYRFASERGIVQSP